MFKLKPHSKTKRGSPSGITVQNCSTFPSCVHMCQLEATPLHPRCGCPAGTSHRSSGETCLKHFSFSLKKKDWRVRKYPTIPTPDLRPSNSCNYVGKNLDNVQPQKRQPKDYASCLFPATRSPPGPGPSLSGTYKIKSEVLFQLYCSFIYFVNKDLINFVQQFEKN